MKIGGRTRWYGGIGRRYIAVDGTGQDAEEALDRSVAKPIVAGSNPATTT